MSLFSDAKPVTSFSSRFLLLCSIVCLSSCTNNVPSSGSASQYFDAEIDKISSACEAFYLKGGMAANDAKTQCALESQLAFEQLIENYHARFSEADVTQICQAGTPDAQCPKNHQLRYIIEHSGALVNKRYP